MPVRQVESTLPRVFEALSTLDPQPGRYLFLENNSSDNTLNLLREFDAPKEIIRLWFLDGFEVPDSWAGVSIARHFLLKRARQLNPDFTLFLDADVIPSRSDLITRLTSWQRDFVAGVYLRTLFEGVTKYDAIPIPSRLSKSSPLMEVSSSGLGVACLSRRIVQDRRLDFHLPWEPQDLNVEDWEWCRKARKLGYSLFVDDDVKCEHLERRHSRPWHEPLEWRGSVVAEEQLC